MKFLRAEYPLRPAISSYRTARAAGELGLDRREHLPAGSDRVFLASFPGRHHVVRAREQADLLTNDCSCDLAAPTQGNLALPTVTAPARFIKIPYSEMAQKYLGPKI